MFLKEIIIHNYKSCQSINLEFDENEPNIFIGLNDSGKSTILQSLELLFNEKPKYNFSSESSNKKDISNSISDLKNLNDILKENRLPILQVENNSTTIIGKMIYNSYEFENFKNISLSNPLLWSIECNNDNEIWLVRNFFNNTFKTFLLARDNEDNAKLWELPQKRLNELKVELEVSQEEIQNENGKGRFTNFELIRAIYNKHNCLNFWIDYKLSKNDKDIFPTFNLFDWNTSLDEITNTANAIMQGVIKEHLDPIKKQADISAKKAENDINKSFNEISSIINSVAKDVKEISSKVYFEVKEKISDIMLLKNNSDGLIHLENQGEGLKRQIWFSLIKAKALTKEDTPNNFLWAFDEPETHLYPGAQRDFFDVLREVSKGNVQTFISTHSTIFIDKSKLNKINSVKQVEGYTEINSCKDIDTIYASLNLKNSDFLFYDKFLVVEGDTEQYLIPELYKIYLGRTLIEDNIQLLNINGKNNWVENKKIIDKILGDFKKSDEQIIYLFDNDMSFEIGESVKNKNMFFIGKQDIEDSLESKLWVDILNDFFKQELNFTIDEIEDLKNKIIDNNKCSANEKFYPILKKLIKNKTANLESGNSLNYKFPSKGYDSAKLILNHLTCSKQIPIQIKNAFNKLRE